MATIDGFTTFKLFQATKLHFTNESYDIATYQGKVSGTRQSFENRRDKKLFERLGKRFKTQRDLVRFLVANFAYGNTTFVWDIDGNSERCYNQWIKRKESILNVFREDLSFLLLEAEKNKYTYERIFALVDDMEYPILLSYFIGNKISIETMTILNDLIHIIKEWEPLILLWHNEFLRIQRVRYFVKYDVEKATTIFQQFTTDLNFNKFGFYG